MDKTTNHQESEAETELIDIFYKDTYRLNSLISQINQGALQSVTTTQDNSQGSISLHKGSFGIPKLLGIETDKTNSENGKRSIQKTKNPYDDIILQLLEQLKLSPEPALKDDTVAKLKILHGCISLKNYKLFSSMIPMLDDFSAALDAQIQEKNFCQYQINCLKEKSHKTRIEKENLQKLEEKLLQLNTATFTSEQSYKNLQLVLPFLPKGIGLEIELADGVSVTGTLKPEYLIDPEESIFMNYGELLPGKWSVLGIVDSKADNSQRTSSQDPLNVLSQTLSGITQLFFATAAKATIIPLLIYRDLDIQ